MIAAAGGTRPTRLFTLLRSTAARSYLFIAGAALVVYCILMSERMSGAGGNLGALLTVVIAVPGLIGRWVISPLLFLLLNTFLLVDPNFGRLLHGVSYGHSRGSLLDDLLLGAAVLVYLMAQFRLLSILHRSMPEGPRPRRAGQAEPITPRRPPELFDESEVVVLCFVAAGSILAGFAAWLVISEFESGLGVGGAWGLQRRFAQLLLFFWGFMTALSIAGVFLGYRAWRQMSRNQAQMMLRDIGWAQTRREQERIYRWQRWRQGRVAQAAGQGERNDLPGP